MHQQPRFGCRIAEVVPDAHLSRISAPVANPQNPRGQRGVQTVAIGGVGKSDHAPVDRCTGRAGRQRLQIDELKLPARARIRRPPDHGKRSAVGASAGLVPATKWWPIVVGCRPGIGSSSSGSTGHRKLEALRLMYEEGPHRRCSGDALLGRPVTIAQPGAGDASGDCAPGSPAISACRAIRVSGCRSRPATVNLRSSYTIRRRSVPVEASHGDRSVARPQS